MAETTTTKQRDGLRGMIGSPDGTTPVRNGFLLKLLDDADKAARLQAEVERLKMRAEEAEERVDELESEAGRVSAEFEGDLWKAVRRLLTKCKYDWDSDPVTADDAEAFLVEVLDGYERDLASVRALLPAPKGDTDV